MRVLKLTLKKHWFDVMVTGVKPFEMRTPSKWIESRLFDKNGNFREYDYVDFRNGYGNDKPYFRAKFERVEIVNEKRKWYSPKHRLTLFIPQNHYVIHLGEIILKSNIKK